MRNTFTMAHYKSQLSRKNLDIYLGMVVNNSLLYPKIWQCTTFKHTKEDWIVWINLKTATLHYCLQKWKKIHYSTNIIKNKKYHLLQERFNENMWN